MGWCGNHRTDDNTSNPDFAKSIVFDYIFEMHQPLFAEVLDYDGAEWKSYTLEIVKRL